MISELLSFKFTVLAVYEQALGTETPVCALNSPAERCCSAPADRRTVMHFVSTVNACRPDTQNGEQVSLHARKLLALCNFLISFIYSLYLFRKPLELLPQNRPVLC